MIYVCIVLSVLLLAASFAASFWHDRAMFLSQQLEHARQSLTEAYRTKYEPHEFDGA